MNGLFDQTNGFFNQYHESKWNDLQRLAFHYKLRLFRASTQVFTVVSDYPEHYPNPDPSGGRASSPTAQGPSQIAPLVYLVEIQNGLVLQRPRLLLQTPPLPSLHPGQNVGEERVPSNY